MYYTLTPRSGELNSEVSAGLEVASLTGVAVCCETFSVYREQTNYHKLI